MFCKRHWCFENGEEERVGRRDGDEADWPNEPGTLRRNVFFNAGFAKALVPYTSRVKTVTQQITFQDNAQMLGGAKQNSRCGKYSCDS